MKIPFCETCPEPDCNPLDMWPGQPAWEGEIIDETGLAGRARFRNVVRCYYACGRWLIWAGDSPTANTPDGLLSAWKSKSYRAAPDAFRAQLLNITGWLPNQVINPKSYIDAFRFMRALTIIENAGTLAPYKEWQITQGCRIAGFVDVPKTPFRKNLTKVGGLATVLSGFGPVVTGWIQNHHDWIETLKNPYIVGTFGALGMIAGALTLAGAFIQARRNAS